MDAPVSAYRRKVSGLSVETRALLADGAEYWSDRGPADLDDELTTLMNLDQPDQAGEHLRQIAQALRRNQPISVIDLTRALLLTEIGWVSVVLGPDDWHNVYPAGEDFDASDAAHWTALRRAQDELQLAGIPASGTDPFGKHPRRGWPHH